MNSHRRTISALCLVGLVDGATAAGGGPLPGNPVETPRWHIIEGRAVGVHDGDSITLLDAKHNEHKIRLDGIDAPELGQPFGRQSKRNLSDLVFSREAVAECSKIDCYRREFCKVLVGGADAGLKQIRAGMAWYFRRYAKELPPVRRQQYADMEAQAKGEGRGLWVVAEPEPPWDWRQR